MFISTLDLFKVGVGPSSSHTMGPMTAAYTFRELIDNKYCDVISPSWHIQCFLKGSLAHTGKGHATDRAIVLGINGYLPIKLAKLDINDLYSSIVNNKTISLESGGSVGLSLIHISEPTRPY